MILKNFLSKTNRTIAAGFLLIILLGALLLALPVSNRDGEWLRFFDALFVSCSAACVTGLLIVDTWTKFSGFGQLVILLLIQTGGLGFMTIVILFSMALRQPVGLQQRGALMESISSLRLGGVVRLAKRILFGTLIFEGLGTALLYVRFRGLFGPLKGLWYALFHAVSAFCNAGFDLMGVIEPYTSLTPFADDALVNLTVMGLVIAGGIGFIVWDDIITNQWNFRRYSLHAKVMLTWTAALVAAGTALIFVMEREAAMADMGFGERLLASLFQSVTCRTSGFNTVELESLSSGGRFVTVLLMFIGAGTGSSGGGVKVTTIAVLLLCMKAFLRGSEDVDIYGRRMPAAVVQRAGVGVSIYALLTAVGGIIILLAQELPLGKVLFEEIAALSTTGMSLGLTRELETVPRLVIMALMYCGRIGSLTLFMGISENHAKPKLRNPEGKIIVG